MAELTVAGLFATPVLKTAFSNLSNFLKDETVSIVNVKKELEGIKWKMQEIMFIVKEAERQSLYDKRICSRLKNLKDIAYDIDDIIDDCKVKAQACASTSSTGTTSYGTHLTSFSRFKHPRFSRNIAKRVKEMNVKLEEFKLTNEMFGGNAPTVEPQLQPKNPNRKRRHTTQFVVDDLVGGVQEDAKKLMKQLLDENESSRRICVNLAVLGMGGIGKTTLAQKIFDEAKKSRKFQHLVWICVSKDSKENDLVLKEIIRSVGGNHGAGESQNELSVILKNAIKYKKIFLVLDDVWNADVWNYCLKGPLESCANGSKILITTRDANIAKSMSVVHTHEVQTLRIREGWLLLRNNVFETENERNNSEYLKDVGEQIVEKCGQLPLAIKAIAGILKTKEKQKESEWVKIIEKDIWSESILTDDVMKALYLSYEDLPYQHKQCFVYCSLFPEDFIFQEKILVQLWIAEGFLKDMESIEKGEDLYEELEKRNLLQRHNYLNCHKMHDLLRSFGQFLSKDEHCGSLKDLDEYRRRLSLEDENSLVDDSPQRFHKKLRTLMLFNNSELKEIPNSVFQKLQYLRVLSLPDTRIQVIPNSIKNLLHLRYLDLSNSDITSIPESIGYLKNLQILLLNGCKSLKKLPESVTNLQNLMSLDYYNSGIAQMPKGIGRLKQLQYLVFTIAENDNEAKLGSTMQELQSLNLLSYLRLEKLPKNLSLEEAKSGKLAEKIHLTHLSLRWSRTENVSDEDINRVTEVLEELCSPSNLSHLFIYNYYGHTLPNWMSYLGDSSLNNLLQLTIDGCVCCRQLPALGKLPQLEFLNIYKASSIQKIGPEFLGRGDRSSSTSFRPFAKLIQLVLEDFSKLDEWHWDGAEDDKNGWTTPFPCLKYLAIEKCPKLKSLPEGLRHATSLKNLFITDCSSMQHVGNLNSLEYIELVDMKLCAIPSWLSSLVASMSNASSSMSSIQRLHIETGMPQLLRRLCPWDIGLDWPLIKDIPHVFAKHVGTTNFFGHNKSPFSVAAKLRIEYTNPTVVSKMHEMKKQEKEMQEVGKTHNH